MIIAVLSGITISLLRSRQRLIEEKDSYKSNTEALMSEVRRIQADSSTMALDIKTLTMSLDEYKRFRAEDEEKIKKLGIRIKDLEATAKHNVEVDAPIDAEIKDSVMIRDTVPVFLKAVRMDTPYLKINGIIEVLDVHRNQERSDNRKGFDIVAYECSDLWHRSFKR